MAHDQSVRTPRAEAVSVRSQADAAHGLPHPRAPLYPTTSLAARPTLLPSHAAFRAAASLAF